MSWFDRFLRHDELGAALTELAGAHPDLVEVSSIGDSHEGRPIWLATVTDRRTRSAADKPAIWVDGNIHATELAASTAALCLVDRLCRGRDEPRVARALAERTFYVVPRVNPDGAELALADRPRFLRSSTRPWPWRDGWRQPGLHPCDVDGDGRVLTMRLPDPNGSWKAHPDEPSLLVPRSPLDGPDDGPYWRCLVEGEIESFDGDLIGQPQPPEGLDLNRNFPSGWATTVHGSGDHPGSEPEVSAVVRAVVERPNVCGYVALHTYGGVHLRPSSVHPDSDLPATDRWIFGELGALATARTGYPVHSVYEDFTWDRSAPMAGAADDWAYEHLGVPAWTTELWDVVHRVTGARSTTQSWTLGPTVEQELAVLRWARDRDRGEFVEWYPFDHPQLGRVELGGWDELRVWSNPPSDLLEAEVAPHADVAIDWALSAPCLAIRSIRSAPRGEGWWTVRVVVENTGWLDTAVTARGAGLGRILPVAVELAGPVVIEGPARRTLGQLAGRIGFRLSGGARADGTPDRAVAEWLVQGRAGDEVTVTAAHPRAGVTRATVRLES